MTEQADWISPSDAVRHLWTPGDILPHGRRERIIQRAREGLLRARVRDVVKRTLRVTTETAPPEFDENGVQKIGAPLPIWEWPIDKERQSDVPLDEDDWLLPGLSDPGHTWWETGDLELQATNGSREGVSMFGIELCRTDLERMKPPRAEAAEQLPPVIVPDASTPPSGARPIAKDDLRQWLNQFYEVASTAVDWKRDAWPAAQAAFPDKKVTRSAVEELARELGHIGRPGRRGS